MRPAACLLSDRHTSGRTDWTVSLIALLAISTSTLVAALVEPRLTQHLAEVLETRIPRADLGAHSAPGGIIVLGGSATRVEAALRLAQRFPDAPVILSGPGDSEVELAKARISDPARLIIDRRALNTYENAVYSQDFMSAKTGGRWAVVTSALHMPRAVAAFQGAGLSIEPWPVYDTAPMTEARSQSVWHEVFGLAGYWLLGRTRTLFPSSQRTS